MLSRRFRRALPHVKRFCCDWAGNFVFFVPIVVTLNGWDPLGPIAMGYYVASVPTAALGGRLYSLFLKYGWYPLWRERF